MCSLITNLEALKPLTSKVTGLMWNDPDSKSTVPKQKYLKNYDWYVILQPELHSSLKIDEHIGVKEKLNIRDDLNRLLEPIIAAIPNDSSINAIYDVLLVIIYKCIRRDVTFITLNLSVNFGKYVLSSISKQHLSINSQRCLNFFTNIIDISLEDMIEEDGITITYYVRDGDTISKKEIPTNEPHLAILNFLTAVGFNTTTPADVISIIPTEEWFTNVRYQKGNTNRSLYRVCELVIDEVPYLPSDKVKSVLLLLVTQLGYIDTMPKFSKQKFIEFIQSLNGHQFFSPLALSNENTGDDGMARDGLLIDDTHIKAAKCKYMSLPVLSQGRCDESSVYDSHFTELTSNPDMSYLSVLLNTITILNATKVTCYTKFINRVATHLMKQKLVYEFAETPIDIMKIIQDYQNPGTIDFGYLLHQSHSLLEFIRLYVALPNMPRLFDYAMEVLKHVLHLNTDVHLDVIIVSLCTIKGFTAITAREFKEHFETCMHNMYSHGFGQRLYEALGDITVGCDQCNYHVDSDTIYHIKSNKRTKIYTTAVLDITPPIYEEPRVDSPVNNSDSDYDSDSD